RLLGEIPLHQSSLVRFWRMTSSQLGRTCSSHIRNKELAVSSLLADRARCTASLLRSDSADWAIILWYSFKCLFSSAGSFGGSQDGRVRDRTASFSFDTGRGSIIMFVFRS